MPFEKEQGQGLNSRINDFYMRALSQNQLNWAQQDLDYRTYCGDQAVWNQIYGNVFTPWQQQFNFNLVRRIVQMPAGYQRRNRKSTIVIPVENSDQQTADQFTKLLMHINRKDNLNHKISEAFTNALITGMSVIHMYMDYMNDPVNGEIKFAVKPYNSYLMDPFFRNHDLSDCTEILMRTYINARQAKALLPNFDGNVNQFFTQTPDRDGKFMYMPETYNQSMSNLLAYDEYYYQTYRKQKMLVNRANGSTLEWKGSEDKLAEYLSFFREVEVIEQEIPTVNLGILLDGQVMYDGPNPMGIDQYPIVPFFAYYTPELPYSEWRIQGMVRALRAPQFLFNRRKIIELDVLESQKTSGIMAKEDSLVNPKDAYKTGQGTVLWLKQAAQMTDVQTIQPPTISQGMWQVSEKLEQLHQTISGVNEELLGSAVDDKAGILSMLRQGAGLTTLQNLFDQLDLSQKLLGKLQILAIQENWTPGKVQQIVEEQPTQQFYNKNFGKYDAAVEEGYDTTTQRQLQFAQLMYLKDSGLPIPSEVILKAATLQNKNDIIEAVRNQEQQAAQQAQAQAQSAMMEQQATMKLAQARAAADIGLGLERESRIRENQQLAQERSAQATKNDMDALLTFAKAVVELQKADMAAPNEDKKALAILEMIKSIKHLDSMDIDNMAKSMQLQRQQPPQQPTGMDQILSQLQ